MQVKVELMVLRLKNALSSAPVIEFSTLWTVSWQWFPKNQRTISSSLHRMTNDRTIIQQLGAFQICWQLITHRADIYFAFGVSYYKKTKKKGTKIILLISKIDFHLLHRFDWQLCLDCHLRCQERRFKTSLALLAFIIPSSLEPLTNSTFISVFDPWTESIKPTLGKYDTCNAQVIKLV